MTTYGEDIGLSGIDSDGEVGLELYFQRGRQLICLELLTSSGTPP